MTHISELDPAALARLEALGGPGLARKIIALAVHALISSAGNVGAMGLA